VRSCRRTRTIILETASCCLWWLLKHKISRILALQINFTDFWNMILVGSHDKENCIHLLKWPVFRIVVLCKFLNP
jgi:hypothetical protein